jgi:hypothetical protein
MSRLRCVLLLSILGVLTCLVVLAAPLLHRQPARSTHSLQISETTQSAQATTTPAAAANLPAPPQILWEEEHAEPLGKRLPAAASVAAAKRPTASAGRVDPRVIGASAIEDVATGETGPNLIAEAGPSSLAEPEARPQPVNRPEDARPMATKNGETHKTARVASLPAWFRRLPDMVATGLANATAELGLSEPATEPAAEQAAKRPAVKRIEAAAKPAAPKAPAKPRQTPHYRPADLWHEPETLIASLQQLSGNAAAGPWASAVMLEIRKLGSAIGGGSDQATAILDRLAELDRETPELAAKASDRAFARKWREIGYALDRRIDIWRQVVLVSKEPAADAASPALDAKKLADCLAKLDAITDGSGQGQAWREFLLLDALKEHCLSQPPRNERKSRDTAQLALLRLTQTPLTLDQQRFICSPPVTALRVELWQWAAEPISMAELLRDVERYERARLPNDAKRLAVDCLRLSASAVDAQRQLADHVDAYYRNANFRFAVTEELLNDLVPEQRLEYAPVNDYVAGQPVQGQSLAATKLAVRMLPDPNRARLALEVTGEMNALTTTDAGLARFHNESESRYVGRKPMEIDMKGISVWPAEVYVRNNTRLSGLETSVDGVPLLNWLANKAAQSQYYMNLSSANEETRQKIVARASERIDNEVRQRLSEVVERLNQRLFDPLNSLALEPQLIAAQTDEKRFTMRLRVGGEDQLGSHTPRPQAIEDSLASLQIHESVINNGIQRLQLDGRTFAVPELSRYVAARLNCPAPFPTNPENDDAKITFAERNPVVVRCQDGQVVLMLSIARLSKPPRRWRNFQIVAHYRPAVNGRSAQLVREGEIQLYGAKNFGSQVALRGIFGHALSRKTPFNLIPEKIVNQPKLQDAAITQFDIADGWIGLSLGQKPKTALHRQAVEVR